MSYIGWMIQPLLIGIVLAGVPLAFFVHYTKKMLAAEKAKSRSPFTEKLLRPPGESLRLKIDELHEKLIDTGLAFIGLIVVPAMLAMQVPLKSISVILIVYLTIPALCWACALKQWFKLRQLRTDLRNYRLGFEGERYVASELNQLLSSPSPDNYRVFHDFVFDMKPGGDRTTFNIDHILVGPGGVFAIETKTRRKPVEVSDASQKRYKVIWNGSELVFPHYRDSDSTKQARRAASDLNAWLHRSLGVVLTVKPVVILPGWKVIREQNPPIAVWDSDEMINAIKAQKKSDLSLEQRELISKRIEDHCRDIDPE